MFDSLKSLVEQWLNENDIKDCSVIGLGKGHKGVEMYTHKLTAKEFIEQYKSIDNKYIRGWFTPSQYSDNNIYISINKK